MSTERLGYLLDLYKAGETTPAALEELSVLLKGQWGSHALGEEVLGVDWEKMYAEITGVPGKEKIKVRRLWPRWFAAASVAVLLCAGLLLFLHKPSREIAATREQRFKNDVPPGGDKAVLTLGNGKKIVLDSVGTGQLAIEGNTNVVKTGSGSLSYIVKNEKATEISYNELSTPQGGKFQVTLPDGTLVLLNAASSIKYPTAFSGDTREVEIDGEAYFEVFKNPSKPFRVHINGGADVEVLGTHFNINAYDDENVIRTTLLEGSVRFTAPGIKRQPLILKPGQQVRLFVRKEYSGNPDVVEDDDIERTMAWKNNIFIFSKDDIETIMRQIVRWYNVTVQYQGNLKGGHFSGIISRANNVSQVLKMLEATGEVHFKIDGKMITVMP